MDVAEEIRVCVNPDSAMILDLASNNREADYEETVIKSFQELQA